MCKHVRKPNTQRSTHITALNMQLRLHALSPNTLDDR